MKLWKKWAIVGAIWGLWNALHTTSTGDPWITTSDFIQGYFKFTKPSLVDKISVLTAYIGLYISQGVYRIFGEEALTIASLLFVITSVLSGALIGFGITMIYLKVKK